MRDELRSMPLVSVLSWLGYADWKVRKGGSEWAGKCPVHKPEANTTAFSFDSAGRFHCFSCNCKGKGAIDLVMAVLGVGFKEAVAWLEERQGLPVAPVAVAGSEGLPATSNEPKSFTYEKFKVESAWLAERGFTDETLERYGVFQYDNPKRLSKYRGKVLIRIQRFDGEIVAYLARDIRPDRGADPKYLFPAGFAKHLELFGAWQIKNEVRQLPLRFAYLVESPFSVMKFHQLGFPAVSPFGWSLSAEQIGLLSQLARGWVYLPDTDKRAEIGQCLSALSRVCWVKAPPLPEPITDPEALTAEQIRSLT